VRIDCSVRPRLCLWGGILLLLVAAVPLCFAGEIGENLYLKGFVSQGYLNTSDNNYLIPRSVNGSAEFTEAAITLLARPMDRLQVGIQFLGRNFGDTGNDEVVIDWAFGDYRWKDQLGFRAGKVKMPFGLYNEGRDVDMLRTTIFLPQSIYNEKQRDFILAYEGLGVYGNFDLHGGGELDYHLYGGTLNVPDATQGFWGDLFANAGESLEPVAGIIFDRENGYAEGTSDAQYRSMDDSQVTFPWIFGGSLIWANALDGLRLGTTAMTSRYNIQSVLRYDVQVPEPYPEAGYHPYSIDVDETVKIEYLATISAEYLRNNWNLAAEYYQDSISSKNSTGWYVQAGYRVSRLLSLAGYYADAEPVGGDEVIEELEMLGLPDYYGWQRDLTISGRFDLTDFWLFKLEYHFIDGVALTEPQTIEEDLADPKARRWGMFAAKTTFHF
jgi:hypothetical protein